MMSGMVRVCVCVCEDFFPRCRFIGKSLSFFSTMNSVCFVQRTVIRDSFGSFEALRVQDINAEM